MSTTSRPRQRGQGKRCAYCKKAQAVKKGACGKCYYRHVHPRPVKVCVGCGREMQIVARGLCYLCYYKGGRVLGDRKFASREDSPEDCRRAREHEGLFVDLIVPMVEYQVRRAFRTYSYHDAEEMVAEALALAWQLLVRTVADGYDPVPRYRLIAKYSVKNVLRWRRITGKVSPVDVLSARYRCSDEAPHFFSTTLLDVGRVDRFTERVDFRIDREAWLLTLPGKLRRVVDYLASGRTWKEAAHHFRLTGKELKDLPDILWDSWVTFQGER